MIIEGVCRQASEVTVINGSKDTRSHTTLAAKERRRHKQYGAAFLLVGKDMTEIPSKV